MKIVLPFFLCLFVFNLNAQKDTVFIDINDSSLIYKSLPIGYTILDTIEDFANKLTLTTRWVGMSNTPNNTWSSLTLISLDSLQNKFVHWSFRNSNGTCAGVAKFRQNGVLLDSVILTNDSIPVFHSDTFSTGKFDTLQYRARGIGPDTIEFILGFFQIRTEIRIALTTDLRDLISSVETLTIFPNPSHSYIRFNNFELIRSKQYQISNIQGQIIIVGTMQENGLDISQLKPGLYLFMIPSKQIIVKFQKR